MTISRRHLIPASDLAAWESRGYRLVYRCPGGWRVEGEACVVEWTAP